jgi:prepilin-type processing-associated H-X9-DG protein
MCRQSSRTVAYAEAAAQNRPNTMNPGGYFRVNNFYSLSADGPTAWPAHLNNIECNAVFVDGHVVAARANGGAKGESAASQIMNNPGSPIYGPYVALAKNDKSMWVRHDGIFYASSTTILP